MSILDNLLDFNGGKKFYRFGNADGKYWIVPARGMRTALNLYQPSGIKGKAVKALLPCLHWIAPARKAIHAEILHCRLNEEIHRLLHEILNTNDIEFAIFEGTPSASQKMILQISTGEKILGYCKISDREDIYELFRKETDNLNWLKNKGVKGIPAPLFCGKHSGVHLFVQSTKKSKQSKVLHKLTTEHIRFVDAVDKATSVEIPFERSDFYKDLQYLKSIFNNIQDTEKPIFKAGIRHIEEYYSNAANSTFSFFHGDFTPWNIYIENKQLQLFDFEFSARTFPPRMDLVHYFLQILILEKKLKAEEIHPQLEEFKKEHCISNTLTICYLVHILSFYFRLYNGKFDTKDNGYIIWCALLKKQLNIAK